MNNQYEYYVELIKNTGEIKKVILNGKTDNEQSPNIMDVTSKLYSHLSKKGLNPLEWSIVKMWTNSLVNHPKEPNNTIILNNKKIKIKNLTQVYYRLKIEYLKQEDNSIVLSLYNQHLNPVNAFVGISMFICPNEGYELTNILNSRLLNGDIFNNLFINNKLYFDKSINVKYEITEDEILISIIEDNTNEEGILEIKSHHCKKIFDNEEI